MPDVTLLAAVVAGVLSFLTPCILPLVPAYLANIVGVSILSSNPPRGYVLLHTLTFISGFSLVLVGLGACFGVLGARVPLQLLRYAAGGILIAFGLFLVAAARLPWLNYEQRLDFTKSARTGYLRSLFIGASFALGWTPCIGPILGGILTLAWNSQTAWQGTYLLAAYCLGLGVPFILIGLMLGKVSPHLRWLSRHAFATSVAAAALLVSLGVLILTGHLESLTAIHIGTGG
jgi:cytochrome c-type biogenesis protein